MAGLARHQNSVRAKRQALLRTRQIALSSCSANGDLPSTAGPSNRSARDADCDRGREAAVGRGCPRVADINATCVWGRCLVLDRIVIILACLASLALCQTPNYSLARPICISRLIYQVTNQKGWRVVTCSKHFFQGRYISRSKRNVAAR